MYESHFGFHRQPFQVCDGKSSFFVSESATRILPQLQHALCTDLGIAVLTGPIGCGKTTLLRHLQWLLASHGRVVLCSAAGLDSATELLDTLFHAARNPAGQAELHSVAQAGHSSETATRWLVRDRLQKSSELWGPVILMVDDAHLLSVGVLNELRAFSEELTDGRQLVRCLIAGPLALEEELARPSHLDFSGRIRCHAFLQPLTMRESVEYLKQQLLAVGCDLTKLLTADAINHIVAAADGSPRAINLLADESLIVASQKPADQVDLSCVQAAFLRLQHLPCAWAVSRHDGDSPESDDSSSDSAALALINDGSQRSGRHPEHMDAAVMDVITADAGPRDESPQTTDNDGSQGVVPAASKKSAPAVYEFSAPGVFEIGAPSPRATVIPSARASLPISRSAAGDPPEEVTTAMPLPSTCVPDTAMTVSGDDEHDELDQEDDAAAPTADLLDPAANSDTTFVLLGNKVEVPVLSMTGFVPAEVLADAVHRVSDEDACPPQVCSEFWMSAVCTVSDFDSLLTDLSNRRPVFDRYTWIELGREVPFGHGNTPTSARYQDRVPVDCPGTSFRRPATAIDAIPVKRCADAEVMELFASHRPETTAVLAMPSDIPAELQFANPWRQLDHQADLHQDDSWRDSPGELFHPTFPGSTDPADERSRYSADWDDEIPEDTITGAEALAVEKSDEPAGTELPYLSPLQRWRDGQLLSTFHQTPAPPQDKQDVQNQGHPSAHNATTAPDRVVEPKDDQSGHSEDGDLPETATIPIPGLQRTAQRIANPLAAVQPLKAAAERDSTAAERDGQESAINFFTLPVSLNEIGPKSRRALDEAAHDAAHDAETETQVQSYQPGMLLQQAMQCLADTGSPEKLVHTHFPAAGRTDCSETSAAGSTDLSGASSIGVTASHMSSEHAGAQKHDHVEESGRFRDLFTRLRQVREREH